MPLPTPEELEAEAKHEAARKHAFQQHWRTRPDDVCPKVLLYRAEDESECAVSKGEEAAWLERGYALDSEKARAERGAEKAKAAADRKARAAQEADADGAIDKALKAKAPKAAKGDDSKG